MYSESALLEAITLSFNKYKEYGARSTAKLKPLHKYLAETQKDIWGSEYEINFLGDFTKELTVEGKYYPKDVDIAISKNGSVKFCIGLKFVTSNYKQNANNYFENMMGETANIQANIIPYAQFIILRYNTPYYKKNEVNDVSKYEIINKKDIQKYLKLMFDSKQAHRPEMLCVKIVDINEEKRSVGSINLVKEFGVEFAELMEDKLSPEIFFKDIINYKRFIESN
ncbi:MAG: hypothetical protein HY959_12525 [Ignavibacteriae bacterium]|nr:hypothetical protein [Ignavibacteriota bacterium]